MKKSRRSVDMFKKMLHVKKVNYKIKIKNKNKKNYKINDKK